jgi:hypothetical protein
MIFCVCREGTKQKESAVIRLSSVDPLSIIRSAVSE